jgi:hypothetical protein
MSAGLKLCFLNIKTMTFSLFFKFIYFLNKCMDLNRYNTDRCIACDTSIDVCQTFESRMRTANGKCVYSVCTVYTVNNAAVR